MTEPTSRSALAKELDSGQIELLICNAGVFLDKAHDLDGGYPAQMWAESFSANVTGVFLTIQSLLPNLKHANGAKIAILSSRMASTPLAAGGSYIYRASKAAVLNLGRNLATDLKPNGISVGVYHPGWTMTEMGGTGVEIDVADSASGLVQRLDQLSLANTGCFETWDGRDHPY